MSLKTKNKQSLSYRLASRFTAWLILSQVIAAIVLFLILQQGVRNKDRKIVYGEYEEVSLLLDKNNLPQLQQKLNHADELLVRVLSSDGQVVYGRLPKALRNFDLKDIEDSIAAAAQHDGFRTVKPILIGEETIEIFSGTHGDYRLIVGINTDDSEDFLHLFIKAAVISIFVSSLLSLLFGYIYSKQALLPIRHLIRTIQDIRDGNTKNLATVSTGNDELSELAVLFNGMIVQINKLIQSLQQSLDAIAHDLRTPITHLIHRHENFIKSNQATVSREFIMESLEETQRLAGLVTTLLELSEAEAGGIRLQKTSFPIKPLLRECAELYEYVAEEKHIRIAVEGDDVAVLADRNRLKRAIANLIDNALKYSDEKASVTLSAQLQTGEVHIRIEDTGWGIPEADRGKIWERLYRGDSSRSSQGLGLGLSFVKSIIELHGGRVSLENGDTRGTVFKLILPQ